MPALPPFILYAIAAIGPFKYALVFFAAIVEGPIVMIASGFLLKLGYFSLVPIFITLVVGDVFADIGWYYIGYFFLEPFMQRRGHFLGVTPETLEKVKKLFRRYHTSILLISKMSLGLGLALATLLTAGATRIPLLRYVMLNVLGEGVLVLVLMSLGYFFGHLYTQIASGLQLFLLGGGILFVLLALFGFSRYAKSKLLRDL